MIVLDSLSFKLKLNIWGNGTPPVRDVPTHNYTVMMAPLQHCGRASQYTLRSTNKSLLALKSICILVLLQISSSYLFYHQPQVPSLQLMLITRVNQHFFFFFS